MQFNLLGSFSTFLVALSDAEFIQTRGSVDSMDCNMDENNRNEHGPINGTLAAAPGLDSRNMSVGATSCS